MRKRGKGRLGNMTARCRLFFAAVAFLAGLVSTGSKATLYAAQEEASPNGVYDSAGLFTEAEIAELDENIQAFAEESGWSIYAVTTTDAEGKTATAYADDFFDAHSPGQEDGVALLIDMDNREIAISTCGIAIRYLTDERIDNILDDAYVEISNGDYADCMNTMFDGVERYYQMGIPGNQYNYDVETGKVSVYRSLEWFEAAIAFAAALACGILFYAAVVGKYRLRFGTYQYEFRDNGNVNLMVKEDRFINQIVTHRRIPKQTTSSGGHSSGRSSTHHSSSGRSHGGGSRRF